MLSSTNNTLEFNPVMQSPLHPFGLAAKQEKINDSKGAWVNEIPLLGYISLRGNSQNETFVNAVKSALNVALPTKPCSMIYTTWGSIL